jgi:uncharacterized protein YndB with AHSA1/START domain
MANEHKGSTAVLKKKAVSVAEKNLGVTKKLSLLPDVETKVQMRERKKFTLEYPVNASPEFLYSYISTASGLATWFADDVNVDGDIYTFIWEGSEERAKLLSKRMNKYVKFQWIDRGENEFFSFEIDQDELTGDVALVITDFEYPDEIKGTTMIYDVSIDKLRGTIGG